MRMWNDRKAHSLLVGLSVKQPLRKTIQQLLIKLNAYIPWDTVIPFQSICCCSVTQSCLTLCNPVDCSMPGLAVSHHLSWSLLRFMSIELVMLSNRLIFCSPFLLLPSVFPASGSFPGSQFFVTGGQSNDASASASVLPMNIQDWSPSGWTGWISLQSKGLSRVFSNNTVQKHQFFGAQLSLWSNSHIHT